jgi:hypothetical protein
MLLILTSNKDLTADFLIVELIKRGLPYFRLNAEDLALGHFTFSFDEDGLRRTISVDEKTLALGDVSAVWYRRAINPVPDNNLSIAERHFVAGEFRHLVTGLVLDSDILWVNPIDRVFVAEHKLYQLRLARKLGFNVPRTLVSLDRADLQKFAHESTTGTICKPIFHGLFVDGPSRYSIYTRRIRSEMLDSESVGSCPILLQDEIKRQADVRATFIGPHLFVADIIGTDSLVDWRDPQSCVQYLPSSLDPSTEGKCREMLAQLGLRYGAFDFIRTPDGQLVFLEINPTGEWAWLEDRLGFPMRNAFAQLFFGEHQ